MARVWIEVTRSLADRTRNRQPVNSFSPHTHHPIQVLTLVNQPQRHRTSSHRERHQRFPCTASPPLHCRPESGHTTFQRVSPSPTSPAVSSWRGGAFKRWCGVLNFSSLYWKLPVTQPFPASNNVILLYVFPSHVVAVKRGRSRPD